MDQNLIPCELAERDTGLCGCRGGHSLAVLKDVQRAYEARMEVIDQMPASKKLQMQVDVLRSWVGDLVGQNSLLARAVEELEAEATGLFRERRKNGEEVEELRAELCVLRRQLEWKHSDLQGLLEVLRRLREYDNCTLEGIHFYGLTESDIFGKHEFGPRPKISLEYGDVTHTTRIKEYKMRSNRHHRF